MAKNGRPVRVIRIKTLDEKVMGALMMHYMLETVFAGDRGASMPSTSPPSRRPRSSPASIFPKGEGRKLRAP
jgi:hypothetical protein